MTFKLHLALACALTLSCGLAGCADKPLQLVVPVAASLRQPCDPPPGAEAVLTEGDLAAFSDLQEGVRAACEAKRVALVTAIDAHNAKVAKP